MNDNNSTKSDRYLIDTAANKDTALNYKRKRNQQIAAKQKKSNSACERCMSVRGLVSHHIIAMADGGEDSIDNMVTLCSECHREWHRIEGVIRALRAGFDDWMDTPSPSYLTGIFLKKEYGEKTVNEIRALFHHELYNMMLSHLKLK